MRDRSSPIAPLWDADRLRSPHLQTDKAARVQAMFDAIAPTYERVNRIASLGQDARWRRRTVLAAAPAPGECVLDLCCGTGDMLRAFAAAQPGLRLLLGVDFSAEMLRAGQYPAGGPPISLLRADGVRLPLRDACVDIVSCAFGVRNFQQLDVGLREMFRVLRPGGRVVILEFALPDNPILRFGYRLYCERLLPRLASWISRDRTGAYRYLPESIRTFERRAGMLNQLASAGFTAATAQAMNLGGVVLYRAERGGGA